MPHRVTKCYQNKTHELQTFIISTSVVAVLLVIVLNFWLFDLKDSERLIQTFDPTKVDNYLYSDITGPQFRYKQVARHEIDELENRTFFNLFMYGQQGVGKTRIANQLAWRARKKGKNYFYHQFRSHAESNDCVYLKKILGLRIDYFSRECYFGDIWRALFVYGHKQVTKTGIILDDVNKLSPIGIREFVRFGKMNQNHQAFKIVMTTSQDVTSSEVILNGIGKIKGSERWAMYQVGDISPLQADIYLRDCGYNDIEICHILQYFGTRIYNLEHLCIPLSLADIKHDWENSVRNIVRDLPWEKRDATIEIADSIIKEAAAQELDLQNPDDLLRVTEIPIFLWGNEISESSQILMKVDYKYQFDSVLSYHAYRRIKRDKQLVPQCKPQ